MRADRIPGMRCELCIYWKRGESDDEGICCAHPPALVPVISNQITGGIISTSITKVWVPMHKDEYCGEFREMPSSLFTPKGPRLVQ